MATERKGPGSDVQAAQEGDRQALEMVLERLLPRVRNLVRYLVRNDEETDDMAQLALIQIARGIRTFRGDGSLESWADRITVRETLRYKKRRVLRRKQVQEAGSELQHAASPTTTPEGYLARRDAVSLLDSLPEAQRQVVVLHHIVGHSVREVAAVLDIPHETARSRLRLGLTKLRETSQAREEGSTR